MAHEAEGARRKVNKELTGGCLCGSVQYAIKPGFRMKPYACHCTDCQRLTGTAFSCQILVLEKDIEIKGNTDEVEWVQPSGARGKMIGCESCRSRIYASNDQNAGMAAVRVGTLDESKSMNPAAHLWVRSKQSWIELPQNVPALEEGPGSSDEWMELLGPDQ